jgi:midasin
MEALTLMTSALSRLEVGRMGVAAYGGPSGTRVLHDLSQHWSDAAGAAVLGSLHFTSDNTLQDTPLLDLLQTAGHLFEVERHQASSSVGTALPPQLLLIVADGYFHERTALQRAVRQAGCDSTGEGPLIVFIILDAAKESVLDLQQVVFENGVPSFIKYLDGFPFPYYMILRDIQRLPHLLADLLRQWIQVCSG